MLVLSRLPGESIVIGGLVLVQVVEVRGDKVRLGIVAPRDVRVDREEVHALRLVEAGFAYYGFSGERSGA